MAQRVTQSNIKTLLAEVDANSFGYQVCMHLMEFGEKMHNLTVPNRFKFMDGMVEMVSNLKKKDPPEYIKFQNAINQVVADYKWLRDMEDHYSKK